MEEEAKDNNEQGQGIEDRGRVEMNEEEEEMGIMLKQVPWPDVVALGVGLCCQSLPPTAIIAPNDIG